MRRHVRKASVAGATGLALAAGLLVGLPPATATGAFGILVTASVTPRTWLAGPTTDEYRLTFRAQAGMVQSDVVVRRSGDSIVIYEEDGGPSLGVADTTYCKGSSASGPSSEVTCTFPSVKPNSDWVAKADFTDAPRGASFIVEEGSAVRAEFVGSAFDDYFQGGDLPDVASGGDGDDNLYGGASSDSLWGDGGDDDVAGEAGPDRIRGGDGADTLDGEGEGVKGVGDPDSIIGGAGPDDIDARDGVGDFIDCGDPYARKSGAVEQGNKVTYDAKLDNPIDCGTVEIPSAIAMPTISTTTPKVGETITGTLGEWRGTAPIRFSFAFERCPFDLKEFRPCTEVSTGSLDAKGLVNGNPPAYTVTKADQGYYVQFSVAASNTSKQGGGTGYAAAPPTMPVAIPATFALPGSWLPRQQGTRWSFTDSAAAQAAIDASAIAPFADVTLTAISRAKVPKAFQTPIADGNIVDIKVNGKAVTGNTTIEAAADQRADITIRYYSWLEDRKKCSVSENGVTTLQDWAKDGTAPLWALVRYIEQSGDGACPYVIDWSTQVSSNPTFTVTNVALEQTTDPDKPVQLRITVSQPSLKPGLSLMVGAPPNSQVIQRPEDFSIGADGRLYSFPNKARSALWVGLMGDQTREGGAYGLVELYVNGRRTLQTSFQATSTDSIPFSTVISDAFIEPGKARLVVSTLGRPPGASMYVESQVFLDFDIVRADASNSGYLVTWDGRCFTTSGTRGECPDAIPMELAGMKNVIDKSIGYGLGTFSYDWDALRYASKELDKRFVAIGANSSLSVNRGSATARYRDCWLIDVFCHIGNAIEAGAQAIMKPKPTPKKPKPAKQRYVLRVNVLPVNQKSVAGGVVGEGILKVPGVGLINLDGGTLINLDGGTFSREFAEAIKAGLINLDGGTLINLDGGTLINLDGGTLIGLDPSSLINLDGGTLVSDIGGAFAPVPMVSLARVN